MNPPPGVPPDLSGLTINAHYKDISNREYMTVTRQGNIEVFEAVTVSGNTTPGAQIISLYEPHRPGSDVGVETALHSDPGRA